MKNLVVLVDANVILDYYQEREGHFPYAQRFLEYCTTPSVKGYVSFYSISIIWYALRKGPQKERRNILREVTKLLTVTAASHNAVVGAIDEENFSDFEDCLQEKCALQCGADYIVTRNVKDFKTSKIPAVTPAEMCEILSKN